MTGSSGDLSAMFRDDAEERLDRMVERLLALETGQASAAAIDELFRDAHSIKGTAGMMGLEEAATIAHAVEDRFAEARKHGHLRPELIDPLLRALDALRRSAAGECGLAGAAVDQLSAPAANAGVPPPAAPAREEGGPPQEGTPVPDEDLAARAPRVAPAPTGDGREGARAAPEAATRSMRVAAEKVDRLLDAVGETVLHHRRLEHTLATGADRREQVEDQLSRGDLLLDELQEAVISLRTLPLRSITAPFPRAVRDAAAGEGKEVDLSIVGAETQLDRVILDGISQAISHLLRNAVAHGIEPPAEREGAGKPRTGWVELRAEQRGDRVAIEVTDDGRGVDPELLRLGEEAGSLSDVLSESGLSTTVGVTALAGRGVGLDAVRAHVEAAGGTLGIASEPGRGTRVTLLLPISLALLHVLLVERDGCVVGLPLSSVAEVVTVSHSMSLGGRPAIALHGKPLPLVDLVAALGGRPRQPGDGGLALIVKGTGESVALACDRVLGDEEILVKALGPLLAGVPGYLGAAVLGDGRVALIADPAHVLTVPADVGPPESGPAGERPAARILVVDDQFTVRELQRSILEAAGYQVETARDGREAWELLTSNGDVDLVVTDIEMPELDGLELIEWIRRDPERSSLPVVIVTSRGSDEDHRRGLEVGADAYIAKDRFDQKALIETVSRLVGE